MAEARDRAALAAIVAVGKEIVRFRQIAPRFVPSAMLDAVLAPLSEGLSGEAIARLGEIDRRVAALPRARSRILRRMSSANWVEFFAFLLLLCISTPRLGNYMASSGGPRTPDRC